MRECWNRQTGTFEVRVSLACGFKSHLSHQSDPDTECIGIFVVINISRQITVTERQNKCIAGKISEAAAGLTRRLKFVDKSPEWLYNK